MKERWEVCFFDIIRIGRELVNFIEELKLFVSFDFFVFYGE